MSSQYEVDSLRNEDIAVLADFFDALARFDFEDNKRASEAKASPSTSPLEGAAFDSET